MFIKHLLFALMLTLLMGCEEDLLPSNDPLENKESIQTGSTIEDLSFTLSDANEETLSNLLTTHDAVVLYFTMWCPICDSHMSHFRSELKPEFSNVKFLFVDYVSGSVAYSRDAQTAAGYTDFDVIADSNDELENYFNGTMATTVVIDKNLIVQYKGIFKTTNEVHEVLDQL